jgi:hypothetical protein
MFTQNTSLSAVRSVERETLFFLQEDAKLLRTHTDKYTVISCERPRIMYATADNTELRNLICAVKERQVLPYFIRIRGSVVTRCSIVTSPSSVYILQ